MGISIDTAISLQCTKHLYLYNIFICQFYQFLCCLVYSTFPEIEESEKGALKFPKSIEDAKQLGSLLSRYNKFPKLII